jgi:septal ring factor EnvC (AmiA/AmiB activator)
MTGVRKFIFLTISLAFLFTGSFAQKNKNQLQKEKQKNLARIKETEKILTETSKKKKNSLGELSAINQRILDQEALIKSIDREVKLLDRDLQENFGILSTLEDDLDKMKAEYRKMAFAAQRAGSSLNKLTFLFASSTFDQFAMRMKYMEQYSKARKEQVRAIGLIQQQLNEQVRQIDSLKSEKTTLLDDEIKENNQLTSLKKKQRAIVQSLEKEEKSLRKELAETKKAVAKLDKLIAEIVREEMERAARETRAGLSAAASLTSASFEGNKKKFSWPVNGFISQRYGKQRHPVLTRVETWNDGVNIQTKEGEKVKSIFQGEVRRVAFIPAIGTSVIINHGEYFSVYAGLKDVFVKSGQKVTSNQEIGSVMTNGEGISELRFQIRKNIVSLDPEEWLRK